MLLFDRAGNLFHHACFLFSMQVPGPDLIVPKNNRCVFTARQALPCPVPEKKRPSEKTGAWRI